MHCASSKSARFLKSVSGNSIEFCSAKCLKDLATQGNSTNQPFPRPRPYHIHVVMTNEVEYVAISFPVTTNPKRRIWNDERWILFPTFSNSKYSPKLLHLHMKETFHPRIEDQGPSIWHHVRQTCSNHLTGISSYDKVHLWTVHQVESLPYGETVANTMWSDDRQEQPRVI